MPLSTPTYIHFPDSLSHYSWYVFLILHYFVPFLFTLLLNTGVRVWVFLFVCLVFNLTIMNLLLNYEFCNLSQYDHTHGIYCQFHCDLWYSLPEALYAPPRIWTSVLSIWSTAVILQIPLLTIPRLPFLFLSRDRYLVSKIPSLPIFVLKHIFQ